MNLRDFKRVRIGSNYPQVLDIQPIEAHESDGLFASFQGFVLLEKGQKRVELRKKDNSYALFLFRYKDMELPDWWKDSEIIWELETQYAIDKKSAEQLANDLNKIQNAERTLRGKGNQAPEDN